MTARVLVNPALTLLEITNLLVCLPFEDKLKLPI